jgi:hypothetical protein
VHDWIGVLMLPPEVFVLDLVGRPGDPLAAVAMHYALDLRQPPPPTLLGSSDGRAHNRRRSIHRHIFPRWGSPARWGWRGGERTVDSAGMTFRVVARVRRRVHKMVVPPSRVADRIDHCERSLGPAGCKAVRTSLRLETGLIARCEKIGLGAVSLVYLSRGHPLFSGLGEQLA